MDRDRYNVVAIGAGAAGLVSAYIAAAVKAKVALIERNKMGGDCLNYGCVPSKAIIRTANFIADMRRHRELGVRSAKFELDFGEVMDRVHRVIREIEPHDSIERYTGLGVECITGNAEILDPNTVRVGDRTLKTRNIILALGASPLVPKIKGIEQIKYLTSESLWYLRTLPKRLVVLGGGAIGCEMAMAFQRLGSSVTQVEMGERLMPREDRDVAEYITERFRSEGITVLTGAKASEFRVDDAGNKSLVCEQNGKNVTVPFDEILVCAGRRANTGGIDWQKFDVELNPDGTFKVDPWMRVNGSNMYACGDCVGPFQFTHVAAHQAWYCAVNALFSPFRKFAADYRVIPWVTFTDPEVARVGLSEDDAKKKNIDYEVTRYGVDDLDRAIAESNAHGFVKVLTVRGKDRILGATIVSHHAGELITEFVSAMKNGYGLNRILGTIHAYPTWSEANKYAAGVWKKAHAPEGALKWVAAFHRMRR